MYEMKARILFWTQPMPIINLIVYYNQADSCSDVYLATLPPVLTAELCSLTHLAALSATALFTPLLSPSK